MRAAGVAFLAVTFLSGVFPAQAQLAAVPADMTGEWRGVIEGFQEQLSLEPRRNLAITPAGCVWQEVGKAAFISTCAVQGRDLQLTTPASASVRLQHDGNALRGTFTVKGGRRFRLTMWRTSDVAVGWHDAPASSVVGVSPAPPTTGSEKTTAAAMSSNLETRLEQLFPGTSPSASQGAAKPASEVQRFIGTWRGTRNVLCGSETVREYLVDITPGPSVNKVNVHYRRPPMCMEGIDWRTTATFNGQELEFFGNTKRFSIKANGPTLDLNVYWKGSAQNSWAGWTDGAILRR